MTHFMKLQPSPFESIKSGDKKIEMRLNDQKRKLICVGDLICFTNMKTGEQLEVKVIDKVLFKDFEQLYKCYDKTLLGYKPDEIANPNDMLEYYPISEVEKYGVLAIILEQPA